MKRYKNQRIKLLLILVILLVLGIGIGYSVLTEKLDVGSSVSINEMKWDIGFSSSEDNGGSIHSESSISNNGKTLSVLCDFGSTTKQKDCTVKATITNNSTFDVSLTSNPGIVYDDTYIHTLTFKWNNHPTYENRTVLKDNFIARGESEEVVLTIKNKFMSKDNLPSENIIIPVTISLNFAEREDGSLLTKNELAILKSTSYTDTTAFRDSKYKYKIKTITFENKINIPSDAIESWDIGLSQNGNVMSYIVPNKTDSTYYDVYIQSDTQLYANEDMSYWFAYFQNIDSINGLSLLDTSSTVSMANMFDNTGNYSLLSTLNLNNFDTSNVTDMSYMFRYTGYNNTDFTLDVSGFDTSSVTNMSNMFNGTGYWGSLFTLNVSNFDTSNVTDMSGMFASAGYKSQIFTLDVSNFDTIKVTDMRQMFTCTGYKSTMFNLDLRSFNTSNVTNMYEMFSCAGYSNPTFTLDISEFDTSSVTDMSYMFEKTGLISTKLNVIITISNPDVSTYYSMFYGVATQPGTMIIVNYTSETSDLVDKMIATKSADSNVIKGVQVN